MYSSIQNVSSELTALPKQHALFAHLVPSTEAPGKSQSINITLGSNGRINIDTQHSVSSDYPNLVSHAAQPIDNSFAMPIQNGSGFLARCAKQHPMIDC